MTTPRLSIAIPTYNRAGLLQLTLEHLIREAEPFGSEVEIVVSDNGSQDGTQTVLATFSDRIRFHLQSENLGSWRNIVHLATHLVRGEWMLVLGDDDYLVPGALDFILEALRTYPDVGSFYLNHAWVCQERRTRLILGEEPFSPELWTQRQFPSEATRIYDRACELLAEPAANAVGAFHTIFSVITRPQVLARGGELIQPSGILTGESPLLDDVFPHSKVFALTCFRQPMIYLGRVAILQGVGEWEWKRFYYQTLILATRDLLDLYAEASGDPDLITPLREAYATWAGTRTARLFADPEGNFGAERVVSEALPGLSRFRHFFAAFAEECRRLDFAPLEHSRTHGLLAWLDSDPAIPEGTRIRLIAGAETVSYFHSRSRRIHEGSLRATTVQDSPFPEELWVVPEVEHEAEAAALFSSPNTPWAILWKRGLYLRPGTA